MYRQRFSRLNRIELPPDADAAQMPKRGLSGPRRAIGGSHAPDDGKPKINRRQHAP
jgi:hypothetical protein